MPVVFSGVYNQIMQNMRVVDQIWQLVYSAFEGGHVQSVMPAFAAKGAVNELQFRMMRSIAALKTAQQSDLGGYIDAVRGDVLTACAMGWMSDELADRIHRLLDEL